MSRRAGALGTEREGITHPGCQTLSLQPSDTDMTRRPWMSCTSTAVMRKPFRCVCNRGYRPVHGEPDILTGFENLHGSPEEEENQVPIHLESRPKTLSFIKQQRVVKRTSEECITVIFDAEDGEPIEFSSHQTGLVTVTRKEISIHQACWAPDGTH